MKRSHACDDLVSQLSKRLRTDSNKKPHDKLISDVQAIAETYMKEIGMNYEISCISTKHHGTTGVMLKIEFNWPRDQHFLGSIAHQLMSLGALIETHSRSEGYHDFFLNFTEDPEQGEMDDTFNIYAVFDLYVG